MPPPRVLIPLVALVLATGPSFAGAHQTGSTHLHVFGEAGARSLDGDLFLMLRPGFVMEGAAGELILAPALHFTVDDVGRVRLRPEDFAGLRDIGRLLYSLRLAAPSGGWELQAGALAHQTLGAGTLVNAFAASLDPDWSATALRLDIAGSGGGVELLIGDVFSLGPVAARLSLVPMAAAGFSHEAARAWEVGATLAVDPSAPIEVTGELGPSRRPAARTAPFGAAAVDTSLIVYEGYRLSLTPHAAAAWVVAGPGRSPAASLHLGGRGRMRLFRRMWITANVELRSLAPGFVPEPFDTWYSLERWGYPLGGAVPKAAVEGLGRDAGSKVAAAVGLGESMIGASVDSRLKGPSNAAAHLRLAGVGRLTVAAHFALRGLLWPEGGGPTRAGLLEATWRLSDWGYLSCRGGRVFRVDPTDGRHGPAWDLGFALGAAL